MKENCHTLMLLHFLQHGLPLVDYNLVQKTVIDQMYLSKIKRESYRLSQKFPEMCIKVSSNW